MESAEAKVRIITASWEASSWYVEDGVVYVTFDGVTLGFNLSVAQMPNWTNPDKPLNIVLEIPCPPSIP